MFEERRYDMGQCTANALVVLGQEGGRLGKTQVTPAGVPPLGLSRLQLDSTLVVLPLVTGQRRPSHRNVYIRTSSISSLPAQASRTPPQVVFDAFALKRSPPNRRIDG